MMVVLGGAVGLAGLGAAPSQAKSSAEIYVVQGIPGRALDITLDGDLVEEDVATSTVAGPFDVDPGSSTLTVTDGDETVLERTMDVAPGSSSDVVVHLASSTTAPPEATVFDNDLDAVPQGKGRLTVAHTAALPPADIRVDGRVLFSNVANGESLSLVVPMGTYGVDIVPTGKRSPRFLGPLELSVSARSLNRVYAVGDPDGESMNVAVHVLRTSASGSAAPTEVNTGTGGQAVGFTRGYSPLLP